MVSHARPGRIGGIAALCAAMTLVLPAQTAGAAPQASPAAVQRTLGRLARQVDQLVTKYEKARTQLEVAKKKLAVIDRELAAERREQARLRVRVAQIAAAAYKNGTLGTGTFLAAKDPQTALDQIATFTELSSSRSQELTALLASAQRLRREQEQVQMIAQSVRATAASLRNRRTAVQNVVAKQKALLPRTTAATGPVGGTYDGPASGPARKAVQYAYAQLTKPYVWGGIGPDGFDCSGLTMMAWRAAGVSLPLGVPSQYDDIPHVSKADLRAGDLVFFDGLNHAGIYVGAGWFIHAPQTGEVIRRDSLSNSYWSAHYNGAGRP